MVPFSVQVGNDIFFRFYLTKAELLALTAADFNFDKETVTINKSYQRLHGEDVITSPKTKKSNRTIKMPKFLCEEMQGRLNEYLASIDEQAEDMFFRLVKKYAEKQGVIEQLKEENQLEWVQKMNNIRACVREVVENEVIYS